MALLTVLVDQLTKHLVASNLGRYDSWAPIAALSGWLDIHHVTNTGAAFGLFQRGSAALAIVSILVCLAILYYCRHLEDGQWLVRVSLGLQLGGAAGNLIDRLRLGHVTDFIDVRALPVFNVADVAIVGGVMLLVLWLPHRDRQGVDAQGGRRGAAGDALPP
jgi:signal peptidase II